MKILGTELRICILLANSRLFDALLKTTFLRADYIKYYYAVLQLSSRVAKVVM